MKSETHQQLAFRRVLVWLRRWSQAASIHGTGCSPLGQVTCLLRRRRALVRCLIARAATRSLIGGGGRAVGEARGSRATFAACLLSLAARPPDVSLGSALALCKALSHNQV